MVKNLIRVCTDSSSSKHGLTFKSKLNCKCTNLDCERVRHEFLVTSNLDMVTMTPFIDTIDDVNGGTQNTISQQLEIDLQDRVMWAIPKCSSCLQQVQLSSTELFVPTVFYVDFTENYFWNKDDIIEMNFSFDTYDYELFSVVYHGSGHYILRYIDWNDHGSVREYDGQKDEGKTKVVNSSTPFANEIVDNYSVVRKICGAWYKRKITHTRTSHSSAFSDIPSSVPTTDLVDMSTLNFSEGISRKHSECDIETIQSSGANTCQLQSELCTVTSLKNKRLFNSFGSSSLASESKSDFIDVSSTIPTLDFSYHLRSSMKRSKNNPKSELE